MFSMYCIQHCFICRPSDSIVSEDAGIEPRTVATSALAASQTLLPFGQISSIIGQISSKLSYTVKKAFRYSRPQLGCHLPTSPSAGIIYICRHQPPPPRESLVSDIPARDGNIEKLFLQCRSNPHSARSHPHSARSHPHSVRSHPQLGQISSHKIFTLI